MWAPGTGVPAWVAWPNSVAAAWGTSAMTRPEARRLVPPLVLMVAVVGSVWKEAARAPEALGARRAASAATSWPAASMAACIGPETRRAAIPALLGLKLVDTAHLLARGTARPRGYGAGVASTVHLPASAWVVGTVTVSRWRIWAPGGV